jgi:CD109 antigen
MTYLRILLLVAILGLLGGACGGGSPPAAVDGYVALVPRVLRSGETESVSLTLFSGTRLAEGNVQIRLQQGDKLFVQEIAHIEGKGTIGVDIPPLDKGDYEIIVEGPGFKDVAKVQVQAGTILFVETDKPIYKPGQTILMRVVALNSELKPVAAPATVEVQDAKAIKIFKQGVQTDGFGMATVKLPLSNEPNLGVWKIRAQSGDTSTELDVRVEEYVLPKYEVSVELPKQWFLVDEPIEGHVSAKYSFGKQVNGSLKITATRYVGIWEEFATLTTPINDGEADFEIQAVGYVAGVPEAGGLGNVTLEVAVVEKNTGYEEKTSQLVTVAAAPVNIQIIPESPVFKPSLPFNLLLVSETPDGQPVESDVTLDVVYFDENFNQIADEHNQIETKRGTALVALSPPAGAITLNVTAASGDAYAFKEVTAGYSPSGNFIHVEQLEPTGLKIGTKANFRVSSTSEARNFYYEVVSRDRVVFTGSTDSREISFQVTPGMAPSAKLLVYQILPTSEVAADFIPFEAAGEYPHTVTASFSDEESRPGDALEVRVQTEGPAKVGLVAVDRSVFILAENRLNLQQVFAEIERLYQQPQAELHEAEFIQGPIVIPGATETFEDTGLIVLSDKRVPKGKEIERFFGEFFAADQAGGPVAEGNALNFDADKVLRAAAPLPATGYSGQPLAEVQRVRQFFPETWIWEEMMTDGDGKATLPVTAPDTITTWDLRAVAISPEKGLGIAETSLRVFQPFFLSADLPYSAIRGEEFPMKVALYNYQDKEQEFQVEIEAAEWFELLDEAVKTVTVGPNDIGGVEFKIKPKGVGTQVVKVTARSSDAADAVIKSMIVEPEGVQREQVENGVLAAGASRTIDLAIPAGVVPDSARTYVAITGSLLSQTIEGLDQLLQMPYGCGEQNMILFAPDVYILDYLKGTNQTKPEIQAKAETLLITGYQRELTYRRGDGSFSAFGDSDQEGSLFLTAFVLKTFAQAKGLVFIDEAVLTDAARWITDHQSADGSFDAVGFVHHQELLGGLQGKDALTAYTAIALIEAGQAASAERAIDYLEAVLGGISDPYSLALVTYALELADSPSAQQAYDKLMATAEEDEDGLHWGGGGPVPVPLEGDREFAPFGDIQVSTDIEATGYGTLALIQHGDQLNAGRAAKWLAAHRNSLGGFGSTQDTVVALQALTEFATLASADVDLTVTVRAGDVTKDVRVTPENFDVMQIVEVPAGVSVQIEAQGKGQAVFQAVSRYNLPQPEAEANIFDIAVDYDTTNVNVNDIVGIDVSVSFNPPEPFDPAQDRQIKAGMVVLDVSVPTGFAPVTASLDQLLDVDPKVKRYDVAGRKVILYIEDMAAGEKLSFSFDVQALYPVRGKGGASQAYSYYNPQWRGETISEELDVTP